MILFTLKLYVQYTIMQPFCALLYDVITCRVTRCVLMKLGKFGTNCFLCLVDKAANLESIFLYDVRYNRHIVCAHVVGFQRICVFIFCSIFRLMIRKSLISGTGKLIKPKRELS